jgi:hypothetical protein
LDSRRPDLVIAGGPATRSGAALPLRLEAKRHAHLAERDAGALFTNEASALE